MKPLEGKTILVTRSSEDSARWAASVAARGARPVIFPCLRCQPIGDRKTREALRQGLAQSDWLVLTSHRGAGRVAALTAGKLPRGLRVATVGPRTALAARERLGRVDLIARGGTAESLAVDLAGVLSADRQGKRSVLVAGVRGAAGELEAVVRPLNVEVHRVEVYRTIPASARGQRSDLSAQGIDTILLASPSAVEGLMARAIVPEEAAVVTIGPVTSAAARKAGLRVAGEAKSRGLEQLLEAIP